MKLEAYINLHGHAREALTFYQSVLGGELYFMTFGETPTGPEEPSGDMRIPDEWQDKIMHGQLSVGDTSIMACDYPPTMEEATGGYQISILVDSDDEARRIWAGLSHDAQAIRLPLAPTFFSPMFGMLTDKFGIPWMINTNTNKD